MSAILRSQHSHHQLNFQLHIRIWNHALISYSWNSASTRRWSDYIGIYEVDFATELAHAHSMRIDTKARGA
jgi:hypothetical protein